MSCAVTSSSAHCGTVAHAVVARVVTDDAAAHLVHARGDDPVGELLERRARDRLVLEVLRVRVGHEQRIAAADQPQVAVDDAVVRRRAALTDVVSVAPAPSVDSAASAVDELLRPKPGSTASSAFELNTVRPSTATVRHDDPGVRLTRSFELRRRAAGRRPARRAAPGTRRADSTGVSARADAGRGRPHSGARSACTAIAVDGDHHDRRARRRAPASGSTPPVNLIVVVAGSWRSSRVTERGHGTVGRRVTESARCRGSRPPRGCRGR